MTNVAGPGTLSEESVTARWARLIGNVDSYRIFVAACASAASAGLHGADAIGRVFGELLEEMLRRRHAVSGPEATDGHEYLLPRWIACDPVFSPEWAFGGFRVSLGGDEDGPRIKVLDVLTGTAPGEPELEAVALVHKRRSSRRREWIATVGETLLEDFRFFHGTGPSHAQWLERMVEDPGAAEDEALAVWNVFVADCGVPESFRGPGRILTLADLLVLRCGGEQERHRLNFADQQPWATRMLLRHSRPHPDFSPVDENPANGIVVAARALCCAGEHGSGCEKAVRFARFLARHRANPSVDYMLGLDQTIEDRAIRSLLMAAHEHEGGELFSHIGGHFWRARRQIARAALLIPDYRDGMSGGFDCAYAIAVLVIRLMIRDGLSPDDLDTETMACALATVSADCLAAFAAVRLSDPTVTPPSDDADALDVGVLALIDFLGRTRRPGITAGQLVKFAGAAWARGVHKVTNCERHSETTWPPPPGWPSLNDGETGIKHVRFLDSLEGMLAEGRRMKNCLAGGGYHRAALLGELAFFSLRTPGGESTLALQPIVEQCPDGDYAIGEWKIASLRGVGNGEPDDESVRVANALAQRMNESCPRAIPGSETSRRKRMQKAMNESRSFNPDTVVARRRWNEIYLKNLPRRFASTDPGDIVDAYLRS